MSFLRMLYHPICLVLWALNNKCNQAQRLLVNCHSQSMNENEMNDHSLFVFLRPLATGVVIATAAATDIEEPPPPCPLPLRGTFPSSGSPLRTWLNTRTTRPHGRTWSGRSRTAGSRFRLRLRRLYCQMEKFDPFLSLDCARVEWSGVYFRSTDYDINEQLV